MKQDPIEEGRLSDHGAGLGTVTAGMVRRRAREIAIINGRDGNQILDSDLEEARRELQGEEGLNPAPTQEEELPEAKRWDPVGGSTGHKVQPVEPPDEQTYTEKILEEGVADAEHDQALQGSLESRRRDQS